MPFTPAASVLVTGGSGFIGGHLVQRLQALGCRVACLVRATSRIEALQKAGVEVIHCDLADRPGIARALASTKPSHVFHVAGVVRALDEATFMRVNARGVEALAQACADQAEPPVLVFVSSIAAAGPSGPGPRVESEPALPLSGYGRSKHAGEQVAMRYADRVPITVVRPCIVFGPGDAGLFQVWKPIARSRVHFVCGPGEQAVSLIAVADLVDCLVLAALYGERLLPGVAGHGLYFAAAQDVSTTELGSVVARALGAPPPRVVRVPDWSLRTLGLLNDIVSRIRGQPGWIGRDKVEDLLAGSWTCSAAKARQQLSWRPAAPLEQRMRETATWYRQAHWL